MLIDCPRCWTRYRIAADKLRPSGTRLKCTRCGFIFRGSVYDALSEPGEGQEEQPGAASEQTANWEGIEEVPGQAPKKRRGWLWLVLLALLLAAAAAFGYLYSTGTTIRFSFLQDTSSKAAQELDQRSKKGRAAEDIALRNVSQYMVQNKHLGSLLVIEGKAANESGGAKKGVKLRAIVFDDQGRELRSKEFPCGQSLSLAELQSGGKEELRAAFTPASSPEGGSRRIDTGEAVPFMTVFFSPPREMAEFSLRVLRAREAATSS